MYRKQVRRRRTVLVLLIVVSLVLLSTQVSEGDGGPLGSIEKGVSAVLSPIEEGASRALKPARDLINWFDETFDARGDRERLEEENQELREQLAAAQGAEGENRQLRELLSFDGTSAAGGFEPVTARVIGRSPTVWYATVTIDRGSSSGVEENDAVVTGDGLVGRVTEVTGGAAQVTLITDHRSAVSARVLPEGPSGIVEPEIGDPDDLLLDFIEDDEDVGTGSILVTAGWSNGRISSAFPPGIQIGRVTEAGPAEQETYQRIHVQPFADIRNLDLVQVLTGGPERPGVPQ